MGETKTHAETEQSTWHELDLDDPIKFPPLPNPGDTRHRPGACPKCAHESSPGGAGNAWVYRLLRMKPRAAACQAITEEWEASGGLGRAECGCRDPFHGS